MTVNRLFISYLLSLDLCVDRTPTVIVITPLLVDTPKAGDAPKALTIGDVRVDGVDKVIVSADADALEPGK